VRGFAGPVLTAALAENGASDEHTGTRKVWLRSEDHADETDERRAVRI
jgi:hypothetical protein